MLDQDGELEILLRAVSTACVTGANRVLDVGCGFGRILRPLAAAGLAVTGVDVNPEIVTANRRGGLDCLTVDEFNRTIGDFDVILMAHVIEHFPPDALLPFMDAYLDRLRIGGSLIIATPLMSKYFYDDFDHVKPYQPAGILMVFGKSAQVQYYSRNKLALTQLSYRRSPLRICYARSRYVRSPWRFLLMAADLLSAAAFISSAKLIGSTDGWIGVFEKAAGSR